MQHRFTKATTCQINLIAFLDRIIDFLHKENAVNLMCLNFTKAPDTAPQGKCGEVRLQTDVVLGEESAVP